MNGVRRIGTVLVATLTSLVVAAPARADILPATCNTGDRYLNAWAYVTEVGPHHQWHQFQYELGGASTGGESNVNFWVLEYNERYSNAVTVYWNHSPDTLDSGVLYSVTPPWAVYSWGPTNERVEFQAIFDIFGPDPSCPAATVPL